MAEDIIDHIIDTKAIGNEVDAAKTKVQELVDLIKQVKATGIDISTTHSAKEYQALRRELDLLKKQTDVTAAAAINEAKVRQANANATKAEAAATIQNTRAKKADTTAADEAAKMAKINEQQTKILTKSINEHKKVTSALTSEYKLLSKAALEASERAKSYSLTLGKNHPVTIEATKDAAAMNDKLKELDASTKIYNRNVGNYTESFTKSLEARGNSIVNFTKKAYSGLRTLANILPNFGISTALLLIFTGISSVVRAIVGANREVSSFAKNQQILGEVSKEAAKNLGEESAKLELIRLKLNDTNIPAAERVKLAKSYNETATTANQIDTNQIDNLGLINSAIYDQIELIKKRAIARAAETVISDKAEKLQLAIENERTESLKKATIYIKNLQKNLDQRARLGLPVATQVSIDLESAAKAISQNAPKVIKAKEELERALTIGAGLIDVSDIFKPDSNKPSGKSGRDLAEADRKATFEIEKQRLTVIAETNSKIAADNERHIAERHKAAFRAFMAETDLIQLTADFEKKAKGLTKKEIQLINEKANIDLLKAEYKYYDSLLKAKKDFDKEYYEEDIKLRNQLEKGIDDAFKKFEKDLADRAKKRKDDADKAKKEAEDLAKARFNLEQNLSTEIQNLAFTFLDAGITRKKNALQAELDDIERNRAREIELAGNNANLIAGIEARAATARETIARKQRELDVKKAQFDKLAAIASIIQNTAVAIANALKTPVLIPLIVAIGAAQLATVLATPIPKYKHGTERHKGGLAIVGDGGKVEGITLPDGTVMKSPATSTLVDLPAGSKVHPDFNKMMLTATMTKPVEFAAKSYSDSSAKVVTGLKAVEKAIGKIPQTSIEVVNPLRQRIRYGHSINEHLTRNLGK